MPARLTTQQKLNYQRAARRLNRKSKKRIVRYGLISIQLILLAVVAGFVLHGSKQTPSIQRGISTTNESLAAANPLDQLSSADVAVQVARIARLDEAASVTNRADSVNAQLAVTPADDTVIAKPQVVASGLKSKKDIKTYVTVAGDTVESVATKFGVTSDTIRWSNSLTGSNLAIGKELLISPVNGIVYTVKQGDTPEGLAQRYNANKEHIIIFNDAEITGLKVGERIVIPDGVQQQARAASPRTTGFAWGGYAPIYGGNGYDYGYCTWWAAVRRSQIGRPIPSNLGNASTWKVLAQRAGLAVGNVPQTGAVIWTPPRDYYGHVGFVEEVLPDGSVKISEMNVIGWGRVSHAILSPAEASRYSYIY